MFLYCLNNNCFYWQCILTARHQSVKGQQFKPLLCVRPYYKTGNEGGVGQEKIAAEQRYWCKWSGVQKQFLSPQPIQRYAGPYVCITLSGLKKYACYMYLETQKLCKSPPQVCLAHRIFIQFMINQENIYGTCWN